ncbi:hypothetical protein DFH29DRAFT_23803 [Suillus ampliporus]|nr:hypothetical protein DFH29DRAFT_23803 [Suillus ampliporus]
MHKRHDAQRQHIIDSFHDLLFYLHAVSFFLAPSLVPLVFRAVFCQFLCYRPREVDPKVSLRAWFLLTFILNIPSFWLHAREGTVEGRTVVLDFVGMESAPSKMHLLVLDILIFLLQLLLQTLTYEKSLQQSSSITSEVLLPHPLVTTPFSYSIEDEQPKPSRSERTYIVDLRLAPLINRIRRPAPEIVERPVEALPLPNTTSIPMIPLGIQALMRTRGRPSQPQRDSTASNGQEHTETEQRLPGSMGTEDAD